MTHFSNCNRAVHWEDYDGDALPAGERGASLLATGRSRHGNYGVQTVAPRPSSRFRGGGLARLARRVQREVAFRPNQVQQFPGPSAPAAAWRSGRPAHRRLGVETAHGPVATVRLARPSTSAPQATQPSRISPASCARSLTTGQPAPLRSVDGRLWERFSNLDRGRRPRPSRPARFRRRARQAGFGMVP